MAPIPSEELQAMAFRNAMGEPKGRATVVDSRGATSDEPQRGDASSQAEGSAVRSEGQAEPAKASAVGSRRR
jgi:hypothetical protein